MSRWTLSAVLLNVRLNSESRCLLEIIDILSIIRDSGLPGRVTAKSSLIPPAH